MIFDLVMPVYNEEMFLDRVIEKIIALRNCLLEKDIFLNLIAVNDFSVDRSTDILLKYSLKYDWIKFINHSCNKGKGAALRTGFLYSDGDYIGIQDADLEYNPMDYERLLNVICEKKYDVVYGSRYLKNSSDSCFHKFANGFITFFFNLFNNVHLTDVETCYKLFSKDAKNKIFPKLRENRFGFEIEVSSAFIKEKYKILELPIDYNSRKYKDGKKITYKDGIKALFCIIKYSTILGHFKSVKENKK